MSEVHNLCHVAQQVTIPVYTPTVLLVKRYCAGLIMIVTPRNIVEHQCSMTARCLVDILFGNSFMSTLHSTIHAVRYKPPECFNDQGDHHSAVEQLNEFLKTDWPRNFTQPDEYFLFSEKFINLLTQSKRMWDGQFGLIEVVLRRTLLEKTSNRPMHSFAHCAGPRKREF